MNPIILIPLLFMAIILILMFLYKIAELLGVMGLPIKTWLDGMKETIRGWVETILKLFETPFDWMYNTFTTLNMPPEIASALAIMIIGGLTIGAVYLTYEAIKVLST